MRLSGENDIIVPRSKHALGLVATRSVCAHSLSWMFPPPQLFKSIKGTTRCLPSQCCFNGGHATTSYLLLPADIRHAPLLAVLPTQERTTRNWYLRHRAKLVMLEKYLALYHSDFTVNYS